MKILALDASSENCSAALWLDGDSRARGELAGQKHSELLLPMAEALLAEAGLRFDDLDGLAFGAGPGTFTGLRIACGVAQGLAVGAGLPVLGVSTLMALAQSSGCDRVVAALDARMGEIYHAAYVREDGAWREIAAPGVYRPDECPVVDGRGWCLAGNGFRAADGLLAARHAGVFDVCLPDALPQAEAVAALAAPLFAAGLGQDPALAAPVYVRNRVALTRAEQEARRTSEAAREGADHAGR